MTDGGIRPALHPTGAFEFLKSVLDAAETRERMALERAAEQEELMDRERTAIKREENLLVAVREVPRCVTRCHR